MAWLRDYLKGLSEDYPPLEDALLDKRIDGPHRLIDLKGDGVSYDADTQSLTVPALMQGRIAGVEDDHLLTVPDGAKQTIFINPAFHDYMQEYGDKVRYVTCNGTPWLSDGEREDLSQVADYFRTLKSGEKQDLAIINWRKTNAATKDTGHAALSVGSLHFEGETLPVEPQDIGPDGNLLPKTHEVESYRPTAEGSYYPFASMWIDRASRKEHVAAAKERVVAQDSPTAHAAGMLTRSTAKPTGIALATAAVGSFAASKIGSESSGIGKKIAGLVLKGAAVSGAAYGLGRAASIVQNAPGSVIMKSEQKGHGILATLITPMQRDIFEHTLLGLNKTYYKDYQIISNNCADFTEHLMQEIGLNTHHMVDRAMKSEPQLKDFARRAAKNLTIPSHIRPDRHQWATRKAVGEGRGIESGTLELEGETLMIRKLKITGQSSVLIETENEGFFKDTPLETLGKALKEALVVEPRAGKSGSRFEFRPEVEVETQQAKNGPLSR